jgi:hypothetical protein
LIESPIVKVLSTIRKHGVKALLMGGQACVFYGAAEFSKDADIVLLTDPENVARLRAALVELRAQQRYVPGLKIEALDRGHAVHFECGVTGAEGIRLDVMAKLRGVDPFPQLWARRTTFQDLHGNTYDALGLEDLVKAKKTRRSKDWPMVARLVEANYVENSASPTDQQVRFWLRELRTPRYLISVAQQYRLVAEDSASERPLLQLAVSGDEARLEEALIEEERTERQRDDAYWRPLLRELELYRRNRRLGSEP